MTSCVTDNRPNKRSQPTYAWYYFPFSDSQTEGGHHMEAESLPSLLFIVCCMYYCVFASFYFSMSYHMKLKKIVALTYTVMYNREDKKKGNQSTKKKKRARKSTPSLSMMNVAIISALPGGCFSTQWQSTEKYPTPCNTTKILLSARER